MKKVSILFLIALSIQIYCESYFSPLWREELAAVGNSHKIQLKDYPIITGSLQVKHNDTTLSDSLDYSMDNQTGILEIYADYDVLTLEYALFPESLKQRLYNYTPITGIRDTNQTAKLPAVNKRYKPLDLMVKGNKTISISVAEGEDFTLDQNLFLRISGKLSQEINIEAQLSDSESPITPEGNTREISNLDQIFIRLYGKKYELNFGDIEHEFSTSRYLDFNPVFEGIKLRWGDESRITGAAAITRAQNAQIDMNGIDGRQGPYWLSNEFGGESLIIAGSERVYLNGEKMQRGDDYSIDYSEGSITFEGEHFISSADRIYAVYQYSQEDFRQSAYLAEANWSASETISLGGALYYTRDDAENPLSGEFSASDLDSLSAAGDKLATGSGIYETEEGLGEYILGDEGWFEYVGLDSTGTYNITFYYYEAGDYDLMEDGIHYEYVGEGNGNYLPGTKLASPSARGNYTLWGKYKKDAIQLRLEGMLSSYDANTLSAKDDNDNTGWTGSADLDYRRSSGRIKPFVRMFWQKRSSDLYTFDPISSALDYYETILIPDSLSQQELLLSSGTQLYENWDLSALWKQTTADDIRQSYRSGTLGGSQKGFIPELRYRYYEWHTSQDSISATKHSHSGKAAYGYWRVNTGYELQRESSQIYDQEQIKKSDYLYLKYKHNHNSTGIYWEKVVTDSSLVQQKTTTTKGLQLKTNIGRQNLEIDLAHRDVKDSVSTSYDLIKLDYNGGAGKYLDAGGSYQIRNLDYYPRIRELIYVGEAEGSCNENGDEDPEGDYDWEVVSIDYSNPQKSVELSTSGRLSISPDGKFPAFWQKLRLEIMASLNEQSTTEEIKKLYLLNENELRQPETTIYGQNTQQIRVWYKIITNKLNLRVTLRDEDKMDNRYADNQTNHNQKEELYLDWKLPEKLGIKFYLEHNSEADTRYNNQSKEWQTTSELRYNPPGKSYSIKLIYSSEEGRNTETNKNYNSQSYTLQQNLSWQINRNSRIYALFKYKYNQENGQDHYSWLQENRAGNVFIWKLSYNYNLNDFMKLFLEYKADKYPRNQDNHEFKLEISAEF